MYYIMKKKKNIIYLSVYSSSIPAGESLTDQNIALHSRNTHFQWNIKECQRIEYHIWHLNVEYHIWHRDTDITYDISKLENITLFSSMHCVHSGNNFFLMFCFGTNTF